MKPNWNPLHRIWNMYQANEVPSSLSSAVSGSDPHHLAFLRQMNKDLRYINSSQIPLADWEVVVVDLETTGFQPHHGDEIIMIGAVAMRGTQILEQENFSTLVNPKRTLPAHIERLTGITAETLQVAPDLISALSRFFQFVGNRTLIAHHSRHERDFFQSALWKSSRAKFVHRLLDTMTLIRLIEKNISDSSLDTLCARHQIPISHRHNAYHDALAAAKLWAIYLDKTIQLGLHDLQDVYQRISRQ
ncbi:exonuclease domain-containing protein [Brevibacillus sp. SYSU BS000544]|uniref:exonuclease domain-containing protein n=1 Tax=Brevibacillus sp. SYSU BS000544 TaxID=3416443 RepID=UPI003CE5BF02